MGHVPGRRSCQPNSYTSWNLELLSGLAPKLLDSGARIGVVHETGIASWRRELPTLTTRLVTLREPTSEDLGSLVDLLSIEDASRFGIEEAIDEVAVQLFVDRAARDREAGAAFTYVVLNGSIRGAMGLVQVRALDPAFETAEWECTLAPSARGSGVFIETARLVCGFAFKTIGAHRLEARVQLQNGRANGALRKLGAVQEGILRSSAKRRGEYVDQVLWSVLKDDWSDHWVATSLRVH
jgi:RimJ/RimL family protein N-acetyltransferase